MNGAGDAIAALFLAHWLDTRSAAEALGRAAASVFGLLQRTEDAGSREILLVAAQEEFVTPTRTFEVDRGLTRVSPAPSPRARPTGRCPEGASSGTS